MRIKLNQSTALIIFILFNVIGYLSFAINSNEKALLDEARQAFENNKLDRAIELYQKIPQSSDFWLEALEEKAWTFLRKNDVNNALSTVTTLTSDLLAPQIGPEPYLLKAIINYKLCNIKAVLDDFAFFKKRFQSRSEEIEKLANLSHSNTLLPVPSNNTTPKISSLTKILTNEASASSVQTILSKAVAQLNKHKTKLSELKADDFGADIQFLPRYFYRDRQIIASVTSGSDTSTVSRIIQLAQDEKNEIESVLQKMQLLESQIVQQVFAYNKEMQQKRKAKYNNAPAANSLVFPYDSSNDIWIDEIDSFEAATSECPVDPFKEGAK